MQRRFTAILPLALCLAVCLTACSKKDKFVAFTPPQPDQEQAYWRQQYNNARPAAPKAYTVQPKRPVDNSFGEFDNRRYNGISPQPELPPLASDKAALSPPRDVFSGGAAQGGTNQVAFPPANPAPTPMAPRPPQATTFYPIEQLIYGGDYPELDSGNAYRLMPRDIITLTVKDHPEFSGRVEIQPDGTIRIPNSPDLVTLRSLTAEEAAAKIRQTLIAYIKGECKVRVQTNRASGGYYYVFGDVQQPGRFPMGLEPVKLSEAILAANWEANPARRDLDGDELGPSFPAANPRGKYIAPNSADLARVMLITPHRSRPTRTTHDIRAAFMGETAGDPIVRPGQIIVVPSLSSARNAALGLDVPEGLGRAQGGFQADNGVMESSAVVAGDQTVRGFSSAASSRELPDNAGATLPKTPPAKKKKKPDPVKQNLAVNNAMRQDTPPDSRVKPVMTDEYCPVGPYGEESWDRTPPPRPTQEMLENREKPVDEEKLYVGSVYRYAGASK